MTYEEALSYIHSVNWTFCKPGLDRIRALCEALGNPQNGLKFIHVAGTNGKGSFCSMLSSVLRAAGYKTGLFTSPYVKVFNERMAINGEMISNDELAELTEYVRPIADAMEDKPTEFELITAIAFEYFHRHNCDVVVLEAGMGGRLDSTNIICEPLLSVITGIALDHTAFLGDTVEKIAAEKAGIIKAGVPVVYGGYHPAVGEAAPSPEAISCGEVIRQKANEMDAPYLVTDHTKLSNVSADLFGCAFDFEDYKGLHIPLAGLYQPHNAANVLTVVEVIRSRGLVIPEEAVRAGLADVYWPGRFEILSRSPLIIADGGHNPEGIDAAIASVKAYFGKEKILLLTGVMADKDYATMFASMAPYITRFVTVTPDNPRAMKAPALAEALGRFGKPAIPCDSVRQGVQEAIRLAGKDGIVLAFGSLYMVGDIRTAVMER